MHEKLPSRQRVRSFPASEDFLLLADNLLKQFESSQQNAGPDPIRTTWLNFRIKPRMYVRHSMYEKAFVSQNWRKEEN